MKDLVKLEMKKINIKSILIAGAVTSGIVLFYIMISQVLMGSTPTKAEVFLTDIIRYNKIAYTIFIAVLMNKMFSDEIFSRSFSILFTYPISRHKLLITKLILIILITLPFMFISMLVDFVIIAVLNIPFKFVAESIAIGLIGKYILSSFIQSILAIITAFIPLAVDVKYASAQYTLLTSGIMAIFLYSITTGKLFGIDILLLIVTACLGVLIVNSSINYIVQKDIM